MATLKCNGQANVRWSALKSDGLVKSVSSWTLKSDGHVKLSLIVLIKIYVCDVNLSYVDVYLKYFNCYDHLPLQDKNIEIEINSEHLFEQTSYVPLQAFLDHWTSTISHLQ